jgi:hypothetical protein
MVKRKGATRKTRSKKKRTVRRMRGGTCRTDENSLAVSSCGPLKSYDNKNPLFRHYSIVPILEDCIKIASPAQKICYGNTITSCTTVTVVMENNWKIGSHINTVTHYYINPQVLNPETLLPAIGDILSRNPNFTGNIKAIYIYGDSGLFELSKRQSSFVYSRLNNTNSKGQRGLSFTNPIVLYRENRNTIVQALNSIFGNKITDETVIRINPMVTVEQKYKNHFLVNENGELDMLVYRKLPDRVL